jgi:hypothetical protein
MNDEKRDKRDANRDPLTGAPGAHPVGAGLGAAAKHASRAAWNRVERAIPGDADRDGR